ncbi:hypothetical protein ACIRST_38355 [Kitasatospora sp. NPDC101447]|uniref:hypothetical protein n=1 Tax=Kitasatospora sp. NPDC101447 TaxID=3364102 RepID=UPI003822D591
MSEEMKDLYRGIYEATVQAVRSIPEDSTPRALKMREAMPIVIRLSKCQEALQAREADIALFSPRSTSDSFERLQAELETAISTITDLHSREPPPAPGREEFTYGAPRQRRLGYVPRDTDPGIAQDHTPGPLTSLSAIRGSLQCALDDFRATTAPPPTAADSPTVGSVTNDVSGSDADVVIQAGIVNAEIHTHKNTREDAWETYRSIYSGTRKMMKHLPKTSDYIGQNRLTSIGEALSEWQGNLSCHEADINLRAPEPVRRSFSHLEELSQLTGRALRVIQANRGQQFTELFPSLREKIEEILEEFAEGIRPK